MPDNSRRLPLAHTSEGVLAAEIAKLRRDLDDLRSTQTARRGFAAIPVGLPFPWFGPTAPDGCLLLQGQAISRADNPVLFGLWGTTHGAGDGSTTFNVPDAQNRAIIGASGTKALGAKGGAETHTLTVGEMPSHGHGVNDPGHAHGFVAGLASNLLVPSGDFYGIPTQQAGITNGAFTGLTVQNAGGGGAHNNMPPWIAANWCVRAG